MCLALEDFYKDLLVAGVSSTTGDGFDELLQKLVAAEKEFHDVYQIGEINFGVENQTIFLAT